VFWISMSATRTRVLRRAAALALAVSAISAASAQAATPPGFFGVVPSGLQQSDSNRMAQNGVQTVRLQVNWAFIEPQPGQRNWTTYDAIIGSLASAGLQAEPVLLGVPPWISRIPARPPIYSPGQQQAWVSFLGELAGRYGPGGTFWAAHPEFTPRPWRDWEVWNEPNLDGYWGGKPNPRGMVRLLRLTRAGINQADPSAQLAIGGIFPPPRAKYGVDMQTYMKGLYRVRGARDAFDAVALHPYASRPKGVLASTREARRLMNRHGDAGTPLWITEVGWTTGGAHFGKSPFKSTEKQQAKWLRQTFNRLLRIREPLGLRFLIWHAWQDSATPTIATGYTGLVRGDGTAKPSLRAYSQIALAG
jgi:polysaccharide biosynthesis protein PslG